MQHYPGPQPYGRAESASTQAIIALVLAFAGLFFCGCMTSIPAIFVARAELKAIDAGHSSAAGRGLAQAAFWIGVVDTALITVILIVYALLVVFGVAASIAFSP